MGLTEITMQHLIVMLVGDPARTSIRDMNADDKARQTGVYIRYHVPSGKALPEPGALPVDVGAIVLTDGASSSQIEQAKALGKKTGVRVVSAPHPVSLSMLPTSLRTQDSARFSYGAQSNDDVYVWDGNDWEADSGVINMVPKDGRTPTKKSSSGSFMFWGGMLLGTMAVDRWMYGKRK